MTAIAFSVFGNPVPQGSTRAFSRGGKPHTTNDPTGKIERWRGDVRRAMRDVAPDFAPLTGPVVLVAHFGLARPKAHYLPANKSRSVPVLRADAPLWHDQAPDLDKLLRAIGDALEHVAYVDDGQIVSFGDSDKRWSERAGVHIDLRPAG